MKKTILIVLFGSSVLATIVNAQEFTISEEAAADAVTPPSYSPRAGHNYPTELLWGDTHLHTTYFPDLCHRRYRSVLGDRAGRGILDLSTRFVHHVLAADRRRIKTICVVNSNDRQ